MCNQRYLVTTLFIPDNASYKSGSQMKSSLADVTHAILQSVLILISHEVPTI